LIVFIEIIYVLDMRSINLDQLRALQAVVEAGGFTAAARRLNLSQSTVSTQIKELEERFGVQLVARLGKKAFATDAGREALDYAKRIAAHVDDVDAAIRRYRENWLGRVRIAAHETICTHLLAPVLADLHRTHPNLDISISVATSREATQLVVANEVDIAVVTMPVEDRGLDAVQIYEEPLLAILPASAGTRASGITPEELAEHPLILDIAGGPLAVVIHAWFADGGVAVKPAMEMNADETTKSLVAAGFGASIRPASSVNHGEHAYAIRPLKPPLMWQLAMIQRRDKQADAALTMMREALKKLGGERRVDKKSGSTPRKR
jgi:DNA-binding transcriptional LysR family regulator